MRGRQGGLDAVGGIPSEQRKKGRCTRPASSIATVPARGIID